MSIIIRNVARVELPEDKKLEVLRLYHHENRKGESIRNYVYKDGVAFLPLNPQKLQYVSELLGEDLIDQRSPGESLSAPFWLSEGFTLRPYQAGPAQELLQFTRDNNYAVLKAFCGAGKTIVNTWVAGHLQKKTLVLVDQGNLASQWQEAFNVVWGRDAQILDSKSTAYSDVVIATFQFLHVNPVRLKEMKDMFGTCLVDECHISAGETRRRVLLKLNNMYRVGMSATIMRKGFSDETITDLIADVSVEMKDDKALVPDIRFVNTGVNFHSNDPDAFTATLSKLAENDERNRLIIDLIRECARENRKVLLVGMRIDALKYLHSKLSEFCNSVLYVGSTTLKQDRALRDNLESGKTDVILTDKKAEKGLDLPRLDTVIISRPMNNEATITQIVGRVLRPVDGKPTPVVYDLVDRGSLAWRFARNRHWWYKRLGYKFEKPSYFFLEAA